MLWKIKGKRQCWLWLMLPLFVLGGYRCWERTVERQAAEELLGISETAVLAEGRVVKITERESRKEYLLEGVTLWLENSGTSVSLEKLLVYLPLYFSAIEGDRIAVRGELACFEQATNPGQFDYRDYQASLGVNLFLEAETQKITVRGERPADGWLGNLRRYGVSVLLEVGGESGPTMAALVLGDKTHLSDERYELYMDSGIGHILTLSGLHLSLFGVGLFGILRKRLTLPQWPAAVLMAGAICSYVELIGGGISASRAAIALIISLLGGCLGKTYDSLSAAALGMILILVEYPLQIVRPSFWLSFGAVFAMGGVLPELSRWLKPERKSAKALLAALTIQLAMMPVTALNQYTIQTYSVLLNMIVVPMMGAILGGSIGVLLMGMVMPKLAMGLAAAVNLAFEGLDFLCRFSLSLPGSRLAVGCPSAGRLVAYGVLLGGFIFLVCRRNRLDWEAMETAEYVEEKPVSQKKLFSQRHLLNGKAISGRWRRPLLLAAVSLILVLELWADVGGRWLKITFLDVGQGDCICIEAPNGTVIMVDSGSSSDRSLCEYRVKPYLEWAGIDKVDYLVLTHLDEDHISGALDLLESGFPVGTVLISAATTDEDEMDDICGISVDNGAEVVEITQKSKIICGKVEIECIYPASNSIPTSENEASVVLKLTYGSFSCLLTGDLEGSGERSVEEYLRNQPDITVLKVAHHGSKYSTSASFLDVTRPTAAVISCGENNSYGHPHGELLDRLEAIDCDIYITARCGAVLVKTDGRRWRIEGFVDI